MSWAFYQLRLFLTYKAMAAGVRVVLVDPRNTSKTCSRCGYCSKRNRHSQASFHCRKCHHQLNADVNAAINISRAAVKPPLVASAGGQIATSLRLSARVLDTLPSFCLRIGKPCTLALEGNDSP